MAGPFFAVGPWCFTSEDFGAALSHPDILDTSM